MIAADPLLAPFPHPPASGAVVLLVVAAVAWAVGLGRVPPAGQDHRRSAPGGGSRCQLEHHQRHPGPAVDCNGSAGQSWTYTVERQLTSRRPDGTMPGRERPGHRQQHPVIIWDCNGQPTSSGTSTPTARSPAFRLGLPASGRGTATGTARDHPVCVQRPARPAVDPADHRRRPAPAGPCDIYAAGGTPCVAAHSTTRALYGAYSGNLYQVRRSSDNTTRNIGVLTAGGVANAAAQDSFCAGTTCVITVIYDQSGRGNDLWYQGSSVVPGSPQSRPGDRDHRVADGRRQQGLLALHQPRQQLLARRPPDRASRPAARPRACTW